MAEAGHNNPPGMIETAGSLTKSLNDWLTDHPVVEDENMARDAKVLLDRGRLGLKDLEDERTRKVRPLNEQVEEINAAYRPSRSLLQKVLDELLRRANDFLAKEEAKRIKIAEEARKKAAEAELAAAAARDLVIDGQSDADHGVCAGGLVEALESESRAIAASNRAARAAALAERETKVRIGGSFTRAMSLRNKEVLTITDPAIAVNAVWEMNGISDNLKKAILTEAKAYRAIHNALPPGIESKTERA